MVAVALVAAAILLSRREPTTREQILSLLEKNPISVRRMCAVLGVSRATALREINLMYDRKEVVVHRVSPVGARKITLIVSLPKHQVLLTRTGGCLWWCDD